MGCKRIDRSVQKGEGIELRYAGRIAVAAVLMILTIQTLVFLSHASAASLNLELSSQYLFPTSRGSAKVTVANPADNHVGLCYTLKIAHNQVLSIGGRCPCGNEKPCEPGSPEDIILWSSGMLLPGEAIHTLKIDAFANNWHLPYGTYPAQMLVEQFSVADNMQLPEAFNVDVFVTVMLEEQVVTVDKSGILHGLSIYNGTANEAAYQLMISAQALRAAAVPCEYASMTDLQAEYTMVPLLNTGKVPARSGSADVPRLCMLSDGQKLPAGTYQTWLTQYQAGNAPIICAKVELTVADHEAQPAMEMDYADALELAQAYVNAAYLLHVSQKQ